MMRLSKLMDYGVVLLNEFSQPNIGKLSASALAQMTDLSEPTVSKILKLLSKADIITSIRGANGGYVLNKEAQDISLAELIVAIDGPIALTACVDTSPSECAIQHKCNMRGRWDGVNDAIFQALNNIKLSEMVPSASCLGGCEQQKMNTNKRRVGL